MNWESWLSETARAAHASDIRELLKLTARPDMISLAGGLPDPALFPIAEYQVAAQDVLARHGSQALQYSTTEGLGQLRTLLVEHLVQEVGLAHILETHVMAGCHTTCFEIAAELRRIER